MRLSEKAWVKYLNENSHKFVVWLVFFFVTAISVFLTCKIIDSAGENTTCEPEKTVNEVKVYFQKSTPDSLLNMLKEEIETIQETLEAIQQDSITVSVQKIKK